ncbi:MAG: hypothetical protein LUG93_16955 [Lachnospiraceae bacterium]|nr:hypothetical protein [Lachnospiraceae bacterium]
MIICEFTEKTVKRETRIYAYSDALMKMQQERMDFEKPDKPGKSGKPEESEEPVRESIRPEKSAEGEEENE